MRESSMTLGINLATLNPRNPMLPLARHYDALDTLNNALLHANQLGTAALSALEERAEAAPELRAYLDAAEQVRQLGRDTDAGREALEPLPHLQVLAGIAARIADLHQTVIGHVTLFDQQHALIVFHALALPLNDPSGRAINRTLRTALHLPANEDTRLAVSERLRTSRETLKKLHGAPRAYVARMIRLKIKDLPAKDEGFSHGLTAHGGNAADRDHVAANTVPFEPDEHAPGETEHAIERLIRQEKLILLEALLDTLNAREAAVLTAMQEGGLEPAEALKRLDFPLSVWNGLKKKAARLQKQHASA
jgi:DNA-directed RNA polymerase specialized sigma24 family protein